jgi:hypothetical protein
LDLYPEEPAAEEPAVEEPAVEEPEPVDPYAEYLGLSPEDAVNLLIEGQEGPVSLDIFANGEDAAALKELIEGMDEELLQVKTIILDSDNPNADRFINAAIYRITPGKMNLLEKLNAMSEDDIDFALYATMEVKDIQGEVNAKRAETKTAEKNGPTKKVKTNNGKAVGKSK